MEDHEYFEDLASKLYVGDYLAQLAKSLWRVASIGLLPGRPGHPYVWPLPSPIWPWLLHLLHHVSASYYYLIYWILCSNDCELNMYIIKLS